MMNRVQEGSEEGICSIVPRFRASIESPFFFGITVSFISTARMR